MKNNIVEYKNNISNILIRNQLFSIEAIRNLRMKCLDSHIPQTRLFRNDIYTSVQTHNH